MKGYMNNMIKNTPIIVCERNYLKSLEYNFQHLNIVAAVSPTIYCLKTLKLKNVPNWQIVVLKIT